jgi:outer membrane immunogenic protein
VNGLPNAFVPVGTEFASYEVDGWQAGGTAGCNLQVGGLVIGAEGDFSWVDASGGSLTSPDAAALGVNSAFEFTTQQNWMGTARGRLGFAADRFLGYATAGVVFGGFELNNQNSNPAATTAHQSPESVDQFGWIVGLGAEVALTDHLSFKAEGLYADYGEMRYGEEPGAVTGCTAGCASADASMTAWMARAGLNLRFGAPPPAP